MTMISRTLFSITTDSAGDYAKTARGRGFVRAIYLDTGDLSTPDVTLADDLDDTNILAVTGVASDGRWYPSVTGNGADGSGVAGSAEPPYAFGTVTLTVAGGGDTKSGVLTVIFER